MPTMPLNGDLLFGSAGQVSNLGLGHDLTVQGLESHDGLCVDSGETAWDLFCLLLPTSPLSK